MKRLLILTLVVLLGAGTALAQDQDETPRGAINFILAGSPAPFGLGAEVFLGPLGLGGTFTALPLGAGGNFIVIYEPGAYGRLYFSNPESALYASASTSYISIAGGSFDEIGFIDGGILRLNGALGYNAFFGRGNSTRFAVELGPRFNQVIVKGDNVNNANWIFIHFMLMFGKTF
jgi:hypothetical protein